MERVRVNFVDLFLEIWRSKPEINTSKERKERIESLAPGKTAKNLNETWEHIEATLEKGIYDEPNNKIVDTIEVDNEKILKKHSKAKAKKQEGKERE